MTNTKSANMRTAPEIGTDSAALPPVVDRAKFTAQLDDLRIREKAHTHEGDAITAARRRLPMVEVDSSLTLIGPRGAVTLIDAFEGRTQLIAYYFMWHTGDPAPEQCEGCTWVTHADPGALLSSLPRRDLRRPPQARSSTQTTRWCLANASICCPAHSEGYIDSLSVLRYSRDRVPA